MTGARHRSKPLDVPRGHERFVSWLSQQHGWPIIGTSRVVGAITPGDRSIMYPRRHCDKLTFTFFLSFPKLPWSLDQQQNTSKSAWKSLKTPLRIHPATKLCFLSSVMSLNSQDYKLCWKNIELHKYRACYLLVKSNKYLAVSISTRL